jgi:hypothetical protein
MLIRQPTGVKNQTGSFSLKWNENFSATRSVQFTKAQKFVDSEVIRRMAPYTPMDKGGLYKSPIIGSKIGSGEIHQNMPYAKYQYYGKVMVSVRTRSAWAKSGEKKVLTNVDLVYSKMRHPKAGKMWFEVMKTNDKDDIQRGMRKYMR